MLGPARPRPEAGCAITSPRTANQILDGLLFGLGVLAVYLGAVLTGAIIRSLGGAGSKGLTVLGRYATGWFDYVRGDDRNTINVTLNMVVDGHLKFDTIVADRRIWSRLAERLSGAPDPPRRQAHDASTIPSSCFRQAPPRAAAQPSADASPTCSQA